MINYWWATRPKRSLNSIPEVLAAIADVALNAQWDAQRRTHLSFESALETAGIKREGERRDQTGGGGRTYLAWVSSLGLVFRQEGTGDLKLTLAGEAILAGDSSVAVIKNQVLKYQFPSSYSQGKGVNLNPRFRLRPFRFLLRLLSDPYISFLSEDEIAKVVIVEAENETELCYRKVVDKLLMFRSLGDASLDHDFLEKYHSSKGINLSNPYSNLGAVANTFELWLEYTQLARRGNDKLIRILPDKKAEVETLLAHKPSFVDRPEQHEYFQRKYGLDPKHKKDTRNLSQAKTITAKMLIDQKIQSAFISESLKSPIAKITADLVGKVAETVGADLRLVEETLQRLYPHGAIGSFMTEYFEMAFKGRDEALPFEQATSELFKSVFGFETHHIGAIGKTPDVLVLSNSEGYSGIIDNKAYSSYSISNDHHNRMVHNYISGLGNYYKGGLPLAFFMYIAGGFGSSIDSQIQEIVRETSVHGSAISVSNIINLVEKHSNGEHDHAWLRSLFTLDKQVLLGEL
ncbi:MAG: restriction endonuclease [Clostridiales bacterium]|jgi:hypothetical protein|nr:restriction endonuclease [Clostridiales bacterium]